MKLWQRDAQHDQLVNNFTTGMDQILDLQLAPFDVLGSMAHAEMLASINILTEEERKVLK